MDSRSGGSAVPEAVSAAKLNADITYWMMLCMKGVVEWSGSVRKESG
jgi:hypothetical protein